jgi:hypothetical protein
MKLAWKPWHDVAVGNDLKFRVRVEFGGEKQPAPETLDQINKLLAQVAEELQLR